MKVLTFLIAISSAATWAQDSVMEFDYGQEVKCHTEMKKMGCVDQKGEEVSECVLKNKHKLSTACKSLHQAKSKK
jgi:hypothetical protein